MEPFWIGMLSGLIGFAFGSVTQRFLIDRKFIRDWNAKWTELYNQIQRTEGKQD
jgi:uncharacterized membrane protein YdjX (TVP38/TMEM64 family)